MAEMKTYRSDEIIGLIVDPLNDFLVEGASPLAAPEMRWILPNIAALTDELEKNGCETIIAADSHYPGDEELTRFPPHCMEGTWGAKVVDELQRFVKDGNLVIKSTHNAFTETDLEERLTIKSPKVVVISGVCSDICVIQAVITLSGLSEKFGIEKIIVPKNCTTTFGDERYSAELKDEMIFNIFGFTPKVEVVETQEDLFKRIKIDK